MEKLNIQCDLVTNEHRKLIGLRLVAGANSDASQRFCDELRNELVRGTGKISVDNGQLIFARSVAKDCGRSETTHSATQITAVADMISSVTFSLESQEALDLRLMCDGNMGLLSSLRNGLPLYSGFEVFYFPAGNKTWYTRLRRSDCQHS